MIHSLLCVSLFHAKTRVTAEAQRTRRAAEEIVSALLRVLCVSAVTLVWTGNKLYSSPVLSVR